jgi:hypothetical protein
MIWVLLFATLLALEMAVWLSFVPHAIERWTFIQLNGLVAGMFVTGYLSALGGRQRRSLAEILNDIDRPRPRVPPR